MDEKIILACNRAPFFSDDLCDRGDVDTKAFIQFPLCKIIEPTPPDSAFIQMDFPVFPFAPPPCQCIDVKIAGEIGLIGGKKGSFSASFEAVGDCCEGNYKVDVDAKIPCIPFDIVNEPSDVIINRIPCTEERLRGKIWLDIGVVECTILVKPELEIEIPKPPKIKVLSDVRVEQVECNDGDAWIELVKNGDDCDYELLLNGEIDIPKPITIEVGGQVDAQIGPCGSGGGTLTLVDKGTCCDHKIELVGTLIIPSPPSIVVGGGINISPTSCGSGGGSISLISQDGPDKCTKIISLVGNITLPEPPEINISGEITIPGTPCGGGGSLRLVAEKGSDCSQNIELQGSLTLPESPEISVSGSIDIAKTKCGGGGSLYLSKGGDKCNPTIKLDGSIQLPEPPNITATSNVTVSGGCNASGRVDLLIEGDPCNPTLNLTGNIDVGSPPNIQIKAGAGIVIKAEGDDPCNRVYTISMKNPPEESSTPIPPWPESSSTPPVPPGPGSSSSTPPVPPGPGSSSSTPPVPPGPSSPSSPYDPGCTSIKIKQLKTKIGKGISVSQETLTESISRGLTLLIGACSATADGDDCCVGGISLTGNIPGVELSTHVSEECTESGYKTLSVTAICDTSKLTDDQWADLCKSQPLSAGWVVTSTCGDPSSSPEPEPSSPEPEPSSPGPGPSSPGPGPSPKTASFTAITEVKCSQEGGLEVRSKTFTIDFTNGTISSKDPTPDPRGTSAARSLARDILVSTIQAIRKDPDIMSIIDDPESERAKKSFEKLGLGDTTIKYNNGADSVVDMEALLPQNNQKLLSYDNGADSVVDLDGIK